MGQLGPSSDSLALPGVDCLVGSFRLNIPAVVLERDEILGVFGHSGSGKSTYLRALYLLLGFPRAALMHQEDALLDHLSARQNVELGVLAVGRTGKEGEEVTAPIIASFDLREFTHRRASQLSGGQRRRVYLAQVLSTDPELLLLDEPFTGLGWRYEATVRALIKARQMVSKPSIIVSHDLEFLSQIARRIMLIDDGQHAGWVYPTHSHPREVSELWARTVGMPNILPVSSLTSFFEVAVTAKGEQLWRDTDVIGFWRAWIETGRDDTDPPIPPSISLRARPDVTLDHRITSTRGERSGLFSFTRGPDEVLHLEVSAGETTDRREFYIHQFVRVLQGR